MERVRSDAAALTQRARCYHLCVTAFCVHSPGHLITTRYRLHEAVAAGKRNAACGAGRSVGRSPVDLNVMNVRGYPWLGGHCASLSISWFPIRAGLR